PNCRIVLVPPARLDGHIGDLKMRDVVFTFWHETWTDSMQRLFMTADRLLQTLQVHKDVRNLLIADPFRMGATQFARRLLGRRPVPIPLRPHATGVVSPLRLRR